MHLKLACVILISLFLYGPCSKKRPQPIPIPQPTPTVEPTPVETPTPLSSPSPVDPKIPIAWATPFPVPQYDPQSYIPAPPQGTTVSLKQESEEDYSAKIQAAQDDPEVQQVTIGPGSLKRPVILRRHTKIVLPKGTTLACDNTEPLPQFARITPLSDYGCFLIADGVYVEGSYKPPKELIDYVKFGDGRNWATDPYFKALDALTEDQILGDSGVILEPTFISTSKQPQVTVFQALGDVGNSHTGRAQNITIKGVAIKGRQTLYDGGVRSTILLGNCTDCSVQESFLWDTGSIGITAGGSALEKNNFASGILFTLNIFKGVIGANMASINTDGLIAINNYVRRPGNARRVLNAGGTVGGGGVCGFDQETNSGADHTKFVYVVNNLIDFEGAYQESAGNGICMQDPYAGKNREEVVVANNVIIGGRGERSDHRYMSNGLFLNGLVNPKIINNYVFRTGQNAVQAYNVVDGLIQDNDFEHTGGGGNSTGLFIGVRNTVVRRSHFRTRVNLEINAQSDWQERQGSCGSVFDEVMTNGVVQPRPLSPPCP